VTVLGETKAIKAQFTETRAKMPHATLKGTLYYKYDESSPVNSRMLVEYDFGEEKVSNLYYYKEGFMYSMCTKECTASLFTDMADPLYFRSEYYKSVGNNWYERTQYVSPGFNGEKNTHMVTRIKLGDTERFTKKIQAIEFNDGRIVTITPNTVQEYNGGDSTFERRSNCPTTAECPAYADLVFVLDNSNSLSLDDWKKQADFVVKVLNDFSFEPEGAAMEAAITQFNSPEPYYEGCPDWCDEAHRAGYIGGQSYCRKDGGQCNCNQGGCWGNGCERCDIWGKGCGKNYNNDGVKFCHWDFKWDPEWDPPTGTVLPGDRTATYLSGAQLNSGWTVSSNRAQLIQQMKNKRDSRPTKGHTCQGFGLELARRAFEQSPRNSKNPPPNRIVIAITDGEDECPNMTANLTRTLINDYGSYVIEVGVGKLLEEKYNEDFLRRIASRLVDGSPAYYAIADYSKLQELSEKLFKPICDLFHSECGGQCEAFCACGKCMCPKCDESGKVCFEYNCTVGDDGTSSHGCTEKYLSCPNVTTKGEVLDGICNYTKCHEGAGCEVVDACADLKERNPYDCQRVQCDPKRPDGETCYVFYDDDYCKTEKGGNECKIYKCAREGQSASDKSGCYLELDKNTWCVGNLSGKDCFRPYCNPENGKCEPVDKCVENNQHKGCYSSTCKYINSKGKWDCDTIAIGREADTKCVSYLCENDKWVGHDIDTNVTCKAKLTQQGVGEKCNDFRCDDKIGCTYKAVQGCSVACSDEMIKSCRDKATARSSYTQCILGVCDTTDPNHHVCKDEQKENCIDKLNAEARTENARSNETNVCYTPYCNNGICELLKQTVPHYYRKTRCMEPVCVEKNKRFSWEYVQTAEAKGCKSDQCKERACDDDYGCQEKKDTCESKTTVCTRFTCKVGSDGLGVCEERSLLKETQCIKEVCVNGNEIRFEKKENFDQICHTDDKCVTADCKVLNTETAESKSDFVPNPGPEDCQEDPCLKCTCDPATGKFDISKKCMSGDNCTIDSCNVDGVCGTQRINCYDIVDMSAFPCFDTECTSEVSEKGFKCLKKLLPNAYIDVCGECIKQTQEDMSDEHGMAESVDEVGATTECTGAPAKPLLTEGLAAASIALIILAAVVVGAALAASTVMGTKTLIDRAKGANNQSAHTNPLFEETETEMTNPAFIGE